jgi:hypothetical protein
MLLLDLETYVEPEANLMAGLCIHDRNPSVLSKN